MNDSQYKQLLEAGIPYVPNTKNKRKKLPTPKTYYKIDKIFKKK